MRAKFAEMGGERLRGSPSEFGQLRVYLDRLAGLVARQQFAVRPDSRMNDVVDFSFAVEHDLLSIVSTLGNGGQDFEPPQPSIRRRRLFRSRRGSRTDESYRHLFFLNVLPARNANASAELSGA